jgi:ABC-type transport system substrate-binding protein/DNA-binding SARP family transcriptional activator
MSEAFDFRILGPFEVGRNGETVELPAGKPRALLAVLVLHAGQVVSVDRLVEELWGARPPPTAAKNVQVYVARLRKLIGDGTLVTRAPGYALRIAREQLDAARFEALVEDARHEQPSTAAGRLRAALALWRGPPLADFTYDSFAQEEIRRLEDLRLAALEDRIDADLALGRHEGVVVELESLVRAHPLRERLHAQLMLALYRCGRQADALAAYQAARARLVDELGLEPGPALQQLEQAILQHDPSLQAPTKEGRPGGSAEQHAPRRLPFSIPPGRLLVIVGALVLAALAALLGIRLSSGSPSLTTLPNSVGVIDGGRNALSAVVATGGTPGGIASGAGAVWVSDTPADAVLRIDRSGGNAERIPVGHGPTGIAVGDGQVWVVNQLDRTVSEINPAAGKQVAEIQVGNGPGAIAFGAGSLWIANTTDRTISRIDGAAGKVVSTIELGPGAPEGIAVAGNRVWVTSSAGQLLLVDPNGNRVTQSYPIGNGPQGVAVGSGSVWVANGPDGTVSRFDPGTGRVQKIPVGGSPSGLAYGAGSAWVANGLDGTVSRIDPTSNSVRRVRVGNEPSAVAVVGRDAWMTVLPSAASHRGGTLSIAGGAAARTAMHSADPAVFDGLGQWQLLSLTNDGLVTYRRVGGLVGDTLVPDLATSLPHASDGGRTYTFQLRRGIRYSNGKPVKASDFRRAIERVFELRSAYYESFYQGILGAERCARTRGRCSLRRGVVADDGNATVTFHLSSADPDFLYKLAFAPAVAVPADTSGRDIGRAPLPATGPYMTRSFSPSRSWVLVRNPRFHEWSADAQPDGYPDRIVMSVSATQNGAVRAVERGETDVLLSPPSDSIPELATRYASQLHSDPLAATFAFALNTRVPPFNSLAVRRALNYAIDRGRIAAFSGGELAAQPTCQVLPPNLPGYRPYCPYTLDPSPGGSWTAPDLATAEELVRASGMRGTKVTVLVVPPDPVTQTTKIGAYVVSVLDRLGFRASLKVFDEITPGRLGDSRERPQIGWFTWFDDYPAPSNTIDALLSCHSFSPRDPRNLNFAEFCDQKIDAQIQRAQRLQTRDPGAAGEAWSRIDHELVDRAPWVPLFNPRALTALSARVGNYRYHPFWQVLLDQLWVR